MSLTVWSTKATGAAIAECFLKLGGIPFKRELVNYEDPADNARLMRINPLAQVPTLVLPTGEVLTETLAIMNWVQKQNPDAVAAKRTSSDPRLHDIFEFHFGH